MIRLLQLVVLIFFSILGFITWILLSTPSAEKLKGCVVTKKYHVDLCPGRRQYVSLNHISPYMKNLIVIAEDASFYSHKGFDLDELQNSLSTNIAAKSFLRGGSTITQQLAKNVFLDFDKTPIRKIREALIAYEIEKLLSKNQILERYLNVIEFGPGVMGIGPAARHYFGKSASQLNLLEAAFLVYLVPNPKVHSRVFARKELTPYARYRIQDLTYRLFRFGKISQSQYQTAKELLPDFPWTTLSSFDISRLNGHVEETPASPIDVTALPEEDATLVPVEAPPDEDPIFDTPIEPPPTAAPKKSDSPFEN